MKAASAAMAAHIDQQVTTLATCIRVTRIDGVVLGFTDHDSDILLDSVTYHANTGASRTKVQSQAGVAVNNAEAMGLIDSSLLTVEDIEGGRYRNAAVLMFTVNWAQLSMGKILLPVCGTIGNVTMVGDTYKFELRGLGQAFTGGLCEQYSPICRNNFGDPKCMFDVESLRQNGAVSAVTSRAVFNITGLVDPTLGADLPGIHTTYLAMHTLDPVAHWPTVSFGAVRPANIAWNAVETARGVYDWTLFDTWVNAAQANGVEFNYLFLKTPAWSQAAPDVSKPPDDLTDWDNFVTAVVTRYVGRIQSYELWNEPNDTAYWSATVSELVTMAHRAFDIIRAIDPAAKILTPSPTWTGTTAYAWMDSYLTAGGGAYADVIAYHGYTGYPAVGDSIVSIIEGMNTVLATHGVTKPQWITEGGWGLNSSAGLTSAQQAAFLAQRYLLMQAHGVSRFYWYQWDNTNWGTLWTTGGGINQAGTAYQEMYNWLVGASFISIVKRVDSTYICSFTQAGRQTQAVWNAVTPLLYSYPAGYVDYVDLAGTITALSAGTVSIGNSPILLRTEAGAGPGITQPIAGITPDISGPITKVASPSNQVQNTSGATSNGTWEFRPDNGGQWRTPGPNPTVGDMPWLVTTAFGLSIPPAAAILGVRVRCRASAQNVTTSYIHRVQLFAGGSFIGLPKTPNTVFPVAVSDFDYGDQFDKWDAAGILVADLCNSSGFGFGVQAYYAQNGTGQRIFFYSFTITVFHTLPGGLVGFQGGVVTFITGANHGLSMEVKDYQSGVLTLFDTMPFDVLAGDTLSIIPGCQKTLEACRAFNNVVNFNGEPFVPGPDQMMRSALSIK